MKIAHLFRVMHWDEIRFEIGSMYLRHHHRPMRGMHMDVRMRRRVGQWEHFYYWREGYCQLIIEEQKGNLEHVFYAQPWDRRELPIG